MSNPYTAPQSVPRAAELGSFPDDLELRRLAFRRWICGYAIGCVLGAPGAILCAFAIKGESQGYEFLVAAIGLALLTVAAFAARSNTWPVYVATALAIVWLGTLAVSVPRELAMEPYLPAPVFLFLAFLIATPGMIVLLAAACSVLVDRAILKRRATLNEAARTDDIE